MKTDTLWASIVGGSGLTISYLVGGLDKAISCLAILMVIDFVTGWIIGYKKSEVSSKRAYEGIKKKLVMICMVIAATQADYMTGNNVFRNMIVFYLIGIEFTSLIENASKLGLQFPDQFKERFTQLQPQHKDVIPIEPKLEEKKDEVL
ncbi:holin family protein [Fictibacillus aquaticus]|uniref:Holin n=1 Tax=Fictibacillus aquaticus TaxID=2021314 RepID=A0A235F9Y4_9BACL|nr:phage holin family protein [Fictibacillus aquaticus]OYD57864.1 hypothetical protein CGZ90_08150 [Fictibacillus aquaticus]